MSMLQSTSPMGLTERSRIRDAIHLDQLETLMDMDGEMEIQRQNGGPAAPVIDLTPFSLMVNYVSPVPCFA